jgi:hypothetical protein
VQVLSDSDRQVLERDKETTRRAIQRRNDKTIKTLGSFRAATNNILDKLGDGAPAGSGGRCSTPSNTKKAIR